MAGGGRHPYGTTLLMRDNQANRKLFPKQTVFGHVPVAETECPSPEECPHYRYKDDLPSGTEEGGEGATVDSTPIHVLIAAFRDRLCGRTIHNAFSKAKNPRRVFIRVIDQTEPGSTREDDLGCWETYCRKYNGRCKEDYGGQVQIVRVDSRLSKGPTDARSKLSALVHWDYVHRDDGGDGSMLELGPVHKQDFCMQIDSHMDFHDDWDAGMVAMFHRTRNDYAVLSTYVADIEQNNQDPDTVPNLCMVQFTSSIRNWGTKECKRLVRPKLTNAMWGAGLSFHRCHAELSVPVDPYLDNVFDGEEGSRGIRFFTHGYDVYTPDRVLVTHDYHTHQGNPVVHTWGRGGGRKQEEEGSKDNEKEKGWKWMEDIEEGRSSWHTFGSKRVNMLLGIGSTFDATDKEREERDRIRNSRYGLGTKRTLEQAVEFTGINLLEERMEENKCGNLLWVPYRESGGDYGVVEEVLARTNDGRERWQKQQRRQQPQDPEVLERTNDVREQPQKQHQPQQQLRVHGSGDGKQQRQMRALGGRDDGPMLVGAGTVTTISLLLVLAMVVIVKVTVGVGWRQKNDKHKQ